MKEVEFLRRLARHTCVPEKRAPPRYSGTNYDLDKYTPWYVMDYGRPMPEFVGDCVSLYANYVAYTPAYDKAEQFSETVIVVEPMEMRDLRISGLIQVADERYCTTASYRISAYLIGCCVDCAHDWWRKRWEGEH